MSIFNDIMSSIFGHSAKAETPNAGSPATRAATPGAGTAGPATSTSSPATPRTSTPSVASGGGPSPSTAQTSPVDVAAVLDGLAKKNRQKLNWRKSIVDLMKLLDLDSSKAARKTLAEELHYTGDMKDSAKMNVWLHKQVMLKLAANGGVVPEDLKH